MKRYSALGLLRGGLTGHRHWPQAWRSPEPRSSYDAVIIGGGGHGLATAYHLARDHGMRDIAVLERGWLGGGNTGRNTAVSRSNYFYPESTRFYDHALRRYETLGRDLNFNIMLSQHGLIALASSRHEMETYRRWVTAMQLQSVDARLLDPGEVAARLPLLNAGRGARYPVHGALMQRRAGISRHDAVAWGYARAADALGVDIIQHCEVTDIEVSGGAVRGIATSRGRVRTDKIGLAVAGHSSVLAAKAGVRLPIQSQTLQAMVTEPVKPCLDHIVLSPAVHCYLSQSDRGELVIGGGTDLYPSYSQRGSLRGTEAVLGAVVELFPRLARMKLMRQWAGVVDLSPDTSPIISKTPVAGFYVSTGWGTGGYKAIPAGGETLAWTMAHDRPHELVEPFGLDRFASGRLIDEGAAAGVAH